MNNHTRRAFTIIEVLLILSILLILAGMLLPFIGRYLENRSQPAPAPKSVSAPGASKVVIVVLDASGSMGDPMKNADGTGIQKMAAAKQALATAIAGLSDSTWVGVMVFSGTGYSGQWLHEPGRFQKEVLHAALESLGTDGGTPLGEFMSAATDNLLAFDVASRQLVIVTDGEATDATPNELREYAKRVLDAGIRLDVIGVAMAEDHALKGVATSYAGATDSEKLTTLLIELLAEAPEQEAPALHHEESTPASAPDSSAAPPAPEQ